MPLIQSASKEALQKNIKTEIEAGKDPKQAAAIAYSVQRENDAMKGQYTLLNGDEYIDVDFDKNTVVQYKEDGTTGKLIWKRKLAPGLYSSADEFWQKAGKRMKKVDRLFISKFYNDKSICDSDKPEYIGTIVEFAEGNTQDAFHKFTVGRLFERNELRKLNESLLAFNELSKNQSGYNKVWFDHIIRYNGKKYKVHWGRYDAGSESNATPIDNSDIQEILRAFESLMKADEPWLKNKIKPIDKATAETLSEYMKVENAQPIFGRLVKHSDMYSFVSSKPADDKDFSTEQNAVNYITTKGYKKQ